MRADRHQQLANQNAPITKRHPPVPIAAPNEGSPMTNRSTDERLLKLVEQRWGTDPEQPFGRLALALGRDPHIGQFFDVLTGDESGQVHNLHEVFVRCEQELSYEQVAVALGEAPGLGTLTPAEFLARFAHEVLA